MRTSVPLVITALALFALASLGLVPSTQTSHAIVPCGTGFCERTYTVTTYPARGLALLAVVLGCAFLLAAAISRVWDVLERPRRPEALAVPAPLDSHDSAARPGEAVEGAEGRDRGTAGPSAKRGRAELALAAILVAAALALAILLSSGTGTPPAPAAQLNIELSGGGYSICSVSRTAYTLTYAFRMLNSSNRSANVTVGYYFNATQMGSGTFPAPGWSDQTESTQLNETGPCPGPGATFPVKLLSVTPG